VIRIVKAVAIAVCAVALCACATRTPPRPSGPHTTDPTAIDAFNQATRQCAGLKTITAELRLSGRAGDQKLRGTLITGLAAPASVRFEAVAPFGQPVFILAGRDNRATLLLPRDRLVLRDAPVPDLLERLTGLKLTAGDLRLLLTGCLAEPATPADGRAFSNGWRAVSLGADVTAYLKNVNGAPAVVAADHGNWRVDYTNHQNAWTSSRSIRSSMKRSLTWPCRPMPIR
jgi:outer membrane biogenesis lipoprotein LolB